MANAHIWALIQHMNLFVTFIEIVYEMAYVGRFCLRIEGKRTQILYYMNGCNVAPVIGK